MKQTILSIDQMRNLQELGLDVSGASMYEGDTYGHYIDSVSYNEGLYADHLFDLFKPVYTLQDILEKLPQQLPCDSDKIGIACFEMNPMKGGGWNLGYEYSPDGSSIRYLHFERGELLESAYKMLVWLKEGGYLG